MIKTSKEDRADLDLLVLGFLTKHKGTPRCQLHFIVQGVSLPKDMRKALKNQTGYMRTRPDQVIDRSLQRLRKSGRIRFDRGQWVVIG
jgi:hypothetical protein